MTDNPYNGTFSGPCSEEELCSQLLKIGRSRERAPRREDMLAALPPDNTKERDMRVQKLRRRSLGLAVGLAALLLLAGIFVAPHFTRREDGALALRPAAPALASEEGHLLLYTFEDGRVDPALRESLGRVLQDCCAKLNAGHTNGAPKLRQQLLEDAGSLQVLITNASEEELLALRECLSELQGLPVASEGSTLLFSSGEDEALQAFKLNGGEVRYSISAEDSGPYSISTTEQAQYFFFPESMSEAEIQEFLDGIKKDGDGVLLIDIPAGSTFVAEDGQVITLGEGVEVQVTEDTGGEEQTN
ncbi:hypothetical protein IT575_11685 [bacterium]|nr:hypothetical protein [bacterium]